jgi:hypothetical protein
MMQETIQSFSNYCYRLLNSGKLLAIFLMAAIVASCSGPKPPNSVSVTHSDSMASQTLPMVMEVVAPAGTTVHSNVLGVLIPEVKETANLYQWKNHLVVYGRMNDTNRLRKQIMAIEPTYTVTVYQPPFYQFDRKQCAGGVVAKDWESVLFTANLVSDTALQKEYLNYHARQAMEWPEVAQGFCRADFQQLLLYKNGRQLVLVISIPKGTALDALNPKTTENNPRMDEWNGLMKKYQEGIPGTEPGEAWVRLKAIAEGE